MDCTTLFIDNGVRDAHYMGFCKQVLWQGFHHVDLLDMRHPAFSINLDSTTKTPALDSTLCNVRGGSWDQWQGRHWDEVFRIVKGTFAVEVVRMVHPDDVFWVHDYHLWLMPRLLGSKERKRASYNYNGAREA